MRKNLSVFSLAVLMAGATIYLLVGPKLFGGDKPVCEQVGILKARAQILLEPVKIEDWTPPGSTSVAIQSWNPPGRFAPGDSIYIFLHPQGTVVGTVLISGPYPSITVVVKLDEAEKVREADSIEIGIIEWPTWPACPIQSLATPCEFPIKKNYDE